MNSAFLIPCPVVTMGTSSDVVDVTNNRPYRPSLLLTKNLLHGLLHLCFCGSHLLPKGRRGRGF